MNNQWHLEEYKQLRHEIAVRVQLLHWLIALSSILSVAAIIAAFYLRLNHLFLLVLPLVFSGITFNYQANQMTMEAVAVYLQNKYNDHLAWDKAYGEAKVPQRLTSFLKTIPLHLPMLIPFILFATNRVPRALTPLAWIDIAIFALVIYNFRYKFKK